jgi:DNA-directed RNA polymerase sigma subunit (sigma70/sigma32)
VTDDSSRTLGDSLSTDDAESGVVDRLDMDALRQTLAAAMAQLDDREREIIAMRYGLGTEDGQMMTFNEICPRFGVTAERVRQIEAKVMTKLRESDAGVRDKLAAFLPSLDGVDLDARRPPGPVAPPDCATRAPGTVVAAHRRGPRPP